MKDIKPEDFNMRRDFRSMVKWAIRKSFDNNQKALVSVYDLKRELQKAWDELCEMGEIVYEENSRKGGKK